MIFTASTNNSFNTCSQTPRCSPKRM